MYCHLVVSRSAVGCQRGRQLSPRFPRPVPVGPAVQPRCATAAVWSRGSSEAGLVCALVLAAFRLESGKRTASERHGETAADVDARELSS